MEKTPTEKYESDRGHVKITGMKMLFALFCNIEQSFSTFERSSLNTILIHWRRKDTII